MNMFTKSIIFVIKQSRAWQEEQPRWKGFPNVLTSEPNHDAAVATLRVDNLRRPIPETIYQDANSSRNQQRAKCPQENKYRCKCVPTFISNILQIVCPPKKQKSSTTTTCFETTQNL